MVGRACTQPHFRPRTCLFRRSVAYVSSSIGEIRNVSAKRVFGQQAVVDETPCRVPVCKLLEVSTHHQASISEWGFAGMR